MGGFHAGGEDAEVENLLNQLEDESLLKLKLNSHRTTGVKAPSNASATVVEATGGVEDDLLARFANLKSRPAGGGKNNRGGESPAKNHEVGSSLEQADDEEDDEFSDLEVRLNALKTHGSGESFSKKSTSVASPFTPSSPKPGSKSRSFSPMKLVKQLSMGKKKKKSGGMPGLNDSISDVDKLLASAADELILEKKNKVKKSEVEDEDDEDDDNDLDEEDACDDRLLKDLNVKKLKKELRVASLEEDRLSREAQQVIEWAKDAARLESAASGKSEESDMEELLKLAVEKKKKGKKWNLF